MTQTLFDVAILAGGLGTRLRPLTDSIPKALIPIQGEPFVAHQLRFLKKQGIERVMICIGNLGHMLQDFVGDGSQFQLTVNYSLDGDNLVGTAGALKRASSQLSDHFFVLYGDSYLSCDFSAVQKRFLQSGKKSLMTVFHNQNTWDKSNIEFDGEEIIAYDKKNPTSRMHYIDYGLGIFDKRVFAEMDDFDLASVYQKLLMQQELAAHEVKERFYEIGSFEGIVELKEFMKKKASRVGKA